MDFHKFFETWYDQLHHQIRQLTEASRPPTTDDHHVQLTQLIDKVMFHLSEYYRMKSLAANQDVLSIFCAKWSTTLERSLYWIAGWRPTTAFHLIYTESSILFESRMVDILHGVRTGDLGDLSSAQFTRVSDLQCETVQQENAINDQLSEWQIRKGPYLTAIVRLLLRDHESLNELWKPQLVTEMEGKDAYIRPGWPSVCRTLMAHASCLSFYEEACELLGGTCMDLNQKIERLVKIMEKADELRLKTLKAVVELLTPQQAVEFLIAAAQLHFGVHRWGLNHDRERKSNRSEK